MTLSAILLGERVFSQTPPPGPPPSPIEVKKVTAERAKDGTWDIELKIVKNNSVKLPTGTRLRLILRWRYVDLQALNFELPGSRTFEKKFDTNLTGNARNLFFKLELDLLSQEKSVQEKIKKMDEYPGNGPWTCLIDEIPVHLGTEEDLEKQKAGVKEFFKEQILALRSTDKKLGDHLDKVEAGELFQKAGQFDSKSWEIWIEKEIRDPIRAVQTAIKEKKDDLAFLEHQRDLTRYLFELSRAVAKRTYVRSAELYKTLGVEQPAESKKVKNLYAASRKYQVPDLKRYVERICDSQGIKL